MTKPCVWKPIIQVYVETVSYSTLELISWRQFYFNLHFMTNSRQCLVNFSSHKGLDSKFELKHFLKMFCIPTGILHLYPLVSRQKRGGHFGWSLGRSFITVASWGSWPLFQQKMKIFLYLRNQNGSENKSWPVI